jgi:hypothetical protein
LMAEDVDAALERRDRLFGVHGARRGRRSAKAEVRSGDGSSP